MQFTHATRSPRASQIAGRVVCGSKVDIVAGISARDSVATEKSFLQLVFEVLCGAVATLVQLLDCRPPHSLYTLASKSQASQIAGRVVCGSKVDIVAGISARDSVAPEKSFLQLVFEVLCGAVATLVQLLDCRPPHSLYTLASKPQPSVRESCVFCASSDGLW